MDSEGSNMQRIHMLSKRLSNLSSDLEGKKSRLMHTIEQQIKQLSQKVDQMEIEREEKYAAIMASVEHFESDVGTSMAELEDVSKANSADIQTLDDTLQGTLKDIKNSRGEYENRLKNALGTRLDAVRRECTDDGENFVSTVAERNKRMDAELDRIEAALEENQRAWDEDCDAGLQEVGAQIEAVTAAITQSREEQEGAETRWLKNLDEMSVRMRDALKAEAAERAEVEETLVSLLETTCIKIKEAEAL
ncbi:chromosome segregation protein [Carpediemonas membranifera]|uniref:Chromosome segregation protein n=1 Tax=Carpediemonas membranifera TaxID=201153 RepID=A0A8J6ARC6_9EUKA|nr:chromosome segregation protein [Carpediemonas membranifera]|eukprot:KAG9390230.1 chromosome segregation protein [Carpediemonas membranifera]